LPYISISLSDAREHCSNAIIGGVNMKGRRIVWRGTRRLNPGITIAKLRLADVNISPLFSRSEERLYVGLKEAGLEEGSSN
jgi:hypothetical protein